VTFPAHFQGIMATAVSLFYAPGSYCSKKPDYCRFPVVLIRDMIQ